MAPKLWLIACFPLACWSQTVDIGVKAGVPLSDAFETQSQFHICFGAGATSATRRYTIGPMVRVFLPAGFAVEFDALYKRLGFNSNTEQACFSEETHAVANSW